MTLAIAQRIITGVSQRHPALSPACEPRVNGDTAVLTLTKLPVTYATLNTWFAEQKAIVVSTGYNVKDNLWTLAFKEIAK